MMDRWEVWIFWITGLLSCFRLSAQHTVPPGVNHFSTADGLPAAVVYRSVQDRRGFIWIGTESGLARFDGQTFTSYTVREGLPEIEVLNLYLDASDRLWIQTLSYLSYYDEQNDSIISLNLPEVHEILSSLPDEEGNIWLTNRNALIKLPNGDPEHPKFFLNELMVNRPTVIAVMENGALVLKAWPDKLMIWNPDTGHYEMTRPFNQIPFLHPHQFLEVESIGQIINTLVGPRVLNNPDSILIPELRNTPITVMKKGQGNSYWFGGSLHGISVFDLIDGQFAYRRTFLESERINDLMIDREGNLWISTLDNGLFLVPATFRHMVNIEVDPERDPATYSLYSQGDSVLWMGGINYVTRMDRSGDVEIFEPLDNPRNYNRTLQITPTSSGDPVFVTDLGVSIFSGGEFRLFSSYKSMKQMAFVGEDEFWWGSATGFGKASVTAMRRADARGESLPPAMGQVLEERTYSLLPIDSDQAWIGGVHGLYLYRQGKLEKSSDSFPYLQFQVSDLAYGPDGALWIASKGGGLIRKSGNTIRSFDESNGLLSMNCRTLFVWETLLYVGTNLGLSVFDLSDSVRGPQLVRTLNTMDGLPSDDIFDICFHDGNLVLATTGGVVMVSGSFMFDSSTRPVLYLNEVQSNGIKLEPSGGEPTVYLSRDANDLILNFSVIDFLGGRNLDFRYKLDELDDDWVHSHVSQARYTHLPSGTYRFRVQVKRSNSEIWSDEEVMFVRIPPPFYLTWWFVSLVLVASTLVLWGIKTILVKRIENQNLQVLVEERTRQLYSSNQELERSNKELRQFAYVVSHDLKSPLRTISSFAQLIVKKTEGKLEPKVNEYLQLVIEGAQKMNALIGDLLTYAQIGGGEAVFQLVDLNAILREVEQNISQNLGVQGGELHIGDLPIIYGIRHQTVLLFQNLLENAIKFRRNEPLVIEVSATQRGDELVISVRDNGIGIPSQYQEDIFKLFRRLDPTEYEGTGIGLSICMKIMELHQGRLELESTEGVGSEFRVIFPAPASADA